MDIIEKYLNRMGGVVGNGHACVLRAICEVIFVWKIRKFEKNSEKLWNMI